MSRILGRGETGFGILIEEDAGYVSKELNTTMITESFQIKAGEPVTINCVLQKYGVENKNGRIYPKDILLKQITEYDNFIKENGGGPGESNHPDSSNVSLHDISHLIKKMWWGEGDNAHILYGQLEIITSPAYERDGVVCMIGDKIIEYMKRGMKLGISSRGVGSLQEIDGKNMVQDDFEIICFDLVTTPSTPGAYLFPNNNEIQMGESQNTNIRNKKVVNEDKISNILDDFLLS